MVKPMKCCSGRSAVWPSANYRIRRGHIFVTAAGGPAVNVLLCGISGAVLIAWQFQPSFNPLPEQVWTTSMYCYADGKIHASVWPASLPLKRCDGDSSARAVLLGQLDELFC